jgi:hypothetical protein
MSWRFYRVPVRTWIQLDERIQLVKWLANQMNVKECDDWYRVSRTQLSEKISLYMLDKYSLKQLLIEAYPNHHWDIHKLQPIHERVIENSKDFFDYLMQQLGYNHLQDFYSLSHRNILQDGYKMVLSKIYVGSIIEALQSAYSNHQWFPWKFEQLTLPRGFWNEKTQRFCMDWIGKEQGIIHLDEWYDKIAQPEVLKKAKKLLRKYGHSPSKLLKAVYPEHKWDLSKFNTVPYGHWDIKENQKKFMDDIGRQLGFKNMQDWY